MKRKNIGKMAGWKIEIAGVAALLLTLYFSAVMAQPGAFSLERPLEGENLSDQTPTFEWEAASGAEYYQLLVDDDKNFSSPVYENDNVGNQTTFTLPSENSLADGVYWWRVGAVGSGETTWSNENWRFMVDTLSPGTPALSLPIDGDNVNDNTPRLEWEPPEENSYPLLFHVQVSFDPLFAPENLVENEVVSQSYFETSELPDNVYYWRVRVRDNAGNWSVFPPRYSFRIDTVSPSVPSLASPADNALFGTMQVSFAWAPSSDVGAGVSHYILQIDNENTFMLPLTYENQNIPGTSHTYVLPKAGRYWWRVRAVDRAGNLSENWSALRSFYVHLWRVTEEWVASLSSPAEWKETEGWGILAEAWTRWSRSEEWNISLIIRGDWEIAGSWSGFGFSPAGSWRLAEGWSGKAEAPVPPPKLVAPGDGENISDNTPLLSWENELPADNFEVQVDDDTNFSSPENEGVVTTNNFTAGPLQDGLYFWRVRAVRDGVAGGWSTRSFRIDTIPPAAPTAISPVDAENENTPIFTWVPPSENSLPLKFLVEVATDNSFVSLVENSGWIEGEEWGGTSELTEGTFWWRVWARDNAGNLGGASEAKFFRIDISPPPTPLPVVPEDSQLLADATPIFSWGTVSDVSGITYELEIVDTFQENLITENHYTLSSEDALNDGEYSWRVRAVDGAGNFSSWSALLSFTIDNTAPSAPSLQSPSNGATVYTGNPTFDWSDVTDPHGVTYTLEIIDTLTASGLENSSYTFQDSLSDGVYSWRVRAVDGAGNVGPWSSAWSFSVWIPKSTSIRLEVEGSTENFEIFSGDFTLITATLKSGGSIISGKRIDWSANAGRLSTTRTITGKYGRAMVTYTAPRVENLTRVTIKAEFAGDQRYLGSRASIGVIVYPIPPKTELILSPPGFVLGPKENLVFSLSLVDNAGNPLARKSLEWGAELGEIYGDNLTDNSGRASAIYIAPAVAEVAVENIRVSFPGDWWYAGSSISITGHVISGAKAALMQEFVENLENSSERLGLQLDKQKLLVFKEVFAKGELGAYIEIGTEEGVILEKIGYLASGVENFVVDVGLNCVAVWLGGENLPGLSVVLNLGREVINADKAEALSVLLNGQPIPRVASLEDALMPDSAKCYVVVGGQGFQVAVSIPQPSINVIVVYVRPPPSDLPSQITLWISMIFVAFMIGRRFVFPKIEEYAERRVLEKSARAGERP